MGRYIDRVEADFRLDADDREDALEAILELMDDPDAARSGRGLGGREFFAWMNLVEPETWRDFEDAMTAWRYRPLYDEVGNVVDLNFIGEMEGDEGQLFRRLTPFVQDGSYVTHYYRDGEVREYRYEGGEFQVFVREPGFGTPTEGFDA